MLAEKLKEMVPGDFSKVFFGLSGSDANDTQIKLMRYYHNAIGKTEKKKVISRNKAYHGITNGAANLAGLQPMHTGFDLPVQGLPAHRLPALLPVCRAGRERGRRVHHAPGRTISSR